LVRCARILRRCLVSLGRGGINDIRRWQDAALWQAIRYFNAMELEADDKLTGSRRRRWALRLMTASMPPVPLFRKAQE
jgi:hypothetical protein